MYQKRNKYIKQILTKVRIYSGGLEAPIRRGDMGVVDELEDFQGGFLKLLNI